jgi:uncharacterized protein (TIGR03435 family)
MRLMKCWLALAAIYCAAYAQSTDQKLTFDVASIKPAAMPTLNGRGMVRMAGPSGGPGSKDPGRVRYPFTTVRNLIMIAYDVKSFQISGPPTLDSERFELQATMPPDTTKEQFHIMLQNLLTERFLLKLHKETKELPMYSLVVGKKGSKLKETGDAPPVDPDAPPPGALQMGPMKMGADGFPVIPGAGRGGISTMMMPNRARLMGQHQTIQDLVNRLTQMLDRPVTDETALKGKYDFTLTYSPEGLGNGLGGILTMVGPPPGGVGGSGGGPGGPPNTTEVETAPDLFTAIQAQLGLKLDAKKGPIEMIVIEHVEKAPTEN